MLLTFLYSAAIGIDIFILDWAKLIVNLGRNKDINKIKVNK